MTRLSERTRGTARQAVTSGDSVRKSRQEISLVGLGRMSLQEVPAESRTDTFPRTPAMIVIVAFECRRPLKSGGTSRSSQFVTQSLNRHARLHHPAQPFVVDVNGLLAHPAFRPRRPDSLGACPSGAE